MTDIPGETHQITEAAARTFKTARGSLGATKTTHAGEEAEDNYEHSLEDDFSGAYTTQHKSVSNGHSLS
jgi:hypothetical protein